MNPTYGDGGWGGVGGGVGVGVEGLGVGGWGWGWGWGVGGGGVAMSYRYRDFYYKDRMVWCIKRPSLYLNGALDSLISCHIGNDQHKYLIPVTGIFFALSSWCSPACSHLMDGYIPITGTLSAIHEYNIHVYAYAYSAVQYNTCVFNLTKNAIPFLFKYVFIEVYEQWYAFYWACFVSFVHIDFNYMRVT